MDLIRKYLKVGEEPSKKEEKKKLQVQAIRYIIIHGQFYKISFTILYFKCLSLDKFKYVLREVHKQAYGNHKVIKAIAYKFLKRGYYYSIIK